MRACDGLRFKSRTQRRMMRLTDVASKCGKSDWSSSMHCCSDFGYTTSNLRRKNYTIHNRSGGHRDPHNCFFTETRAH